MSEDPPFLTRALHPALRPYVGWAIAYDVDLGGPGLHRGLPSTALTLVLPLEERLDVGWAGQESSRSRWRALVSGLHTAPAEIHHNGRQVGVQLALTTSGAPALLGVPAGELAAELVSLDDLAVVRTVAALRDLPQQLAETPDRARQLDLVESALLTALARHGAAGPRAEVGRALAALTRGARVGAVAEEVGWSRRHLSTQVRAECGLAPKEFQRVARFERSHRVLEHAALSGSVRLATLAAETVYADQAHLTREWVTLAGCTPRAWLRSEFPFLQDRAAQDRHARGDGAH